MTVYIIHQPSIGPNGKTRIDISDATRFGETTVLLFSGENPAQNPTHAKKRIAQRLGTYNPDKDYFMWAGGDPVGLLLLGSILVQRGVSKVKWLRYSRKLDPVHNTRMADKAEYIPIEVDLKALPMI